MSYFGATVVVGSGGALLKYSRGQIIRPGIDTKWCEKFAGLDCQVCIQEDIGRI